MGEVGGDDAEALRAELAEERARRAAAEEKADRAENDASHLRQVFAMVGSLCSFVAGPSQRQGRLVGLRDEEPPGLV